MKKALAMLLALIMAFGVLAGCSSSPEPTQAPTAAPTAAPTQAPGSNETEAPTEEAVWFGNPDGTPVHLRFYGGVQPEYGYDDLVANFNEEYKDKGIEVEYVRYVNDTDGNLQLDIYLQGGGDVDLFIGYGGKTRLNNRIAAGLVLDMSDYIDEYGLDLSTALGRSFYNDYIYEGGAVYGFPTTSSNTNWMLANVDMFEEAGVPVPYDGWTYSEFLDACEKLTHGEGQNKVYGMCWSFNENASQVLAVITSVLRPYSDFTSDDCDETAYGNPVVKEGLEMLNTTLVNGWAIPKELEMSENLKVANSFLDGMCAMALCVAQVRLCMDLENYPHDFKTALIPSPVPDGEEYNNPILRQHASGIGVSDLFCIAANTPYPEACWEFGYWYFTGGIIPLAKGGRIPLYTGIDRQGVLDIVTANADGTVDLQSLNNYIGIDKSSALGSLSPSYVSKVKDIFYEEEDALVYGRQDVDTTIQNIVDRCNAMIQSELSK